MKNHKLIYQSSYDRGLEHLLAMWPTIKEKYPDATLDICYGWNTFDKLAANNPERMNWKVQMISAMSQDGITDHGRIGKDELKALRQECGILAYPSHFFEIFCISVVEAELDGVVPVTTNIGALNETNNCGIIIEGDITKLEVQKEYLEALLDLMGDESKRKKMSDKGKEWAKQYDWKNIAEKWVEEFKSTDQSVKLSVYTPTIRKGWINLMAENLSKSTYKNFEWLVVDDYPEDRSKVFKEYAEKYHLDIKYLRGKPRKIKRHYGLCNANNTALENSTGEVLVFLQDFILIPTDGLEQIVTLYKRNPTSLQGLPDMYFSIKGDVDSTKEDWFDGKTDVVGKFIRQNIRIANLGLRKTNNPRDYEQNYGAIPVKVAKELGGWYEFYDEALGYDNTEIAWRALKMGYEIIIDETNVAICLDLWPLLKGKAENGGEERARRYNDARYMYMQKMIEDGKLSLVRKQEVDDTIDLQHEPPKEISNDDIEKYWIGNLDAIVDDWIKKGNL
jgi:glycosyltransferase involved in cell wall biosynthesis